MRDINCMSRGNDLDQNRRNSLPCAQLGLPDRGRAIKGLVVCYVVWLGSMTYGIGLWTSEMCVVLSLVVVRMAVAQLLCTHVTDKFFSIYLSL